MLPLWVNLWKDYLLKILLKREVGKLSNLSGNPSLNAPSPEPENPTNFHYGQLNCEIINKLWVLQVIRVKLGRS